MKELILKNNDISNIEILEKVKFKKLEKLNLEKNIITRINIFGRIDFKELKDLSNR